MEDKDILEYENIGRKIKKSNKYSYIRGKQLTDPGSGTRVYDIDNSRLPSVTTILGTTAPNTPCLLYTSPSPRDRTRSRMPSSA